MAAATPRTIATYEIERELESGGMGTLYLARQPALERRVVLKRLRSDARADRSAAERFVREARTAAELHHQNVVAVYDCFAWRGERYIAQEFVDGVDLASALRSVRRFDPRVAGLVALEVARGLEEIHALGVVHRDLKPANLLVSRAGEVKIADFGIALDPSGSAPLTQTGHAVGTPLYMSPEQLRGERVDARSDLFSFGVVLYELLAGHPPFSAESEGEAEISLLRSMESGRFVSLRRAAPGTPRAIAQLVGSCLRPKAKRRFQHTRALRLALEKAVRAPAPMAVRDEIAEWLWQHRVFPRDEQHTVRAPIAEVVPMPRWVRTLRVAGAVALLAALGAITAGWLSVQDVPPWFFARLGGVP